MYIVSVSVFHRIPSMLTVVLQSMVLLLVTISCRAVLLEAHECRLNPAWHKLFRD